MRTKTLKASLTARCALVIVVIVAMIAPLMSTRAAGPPIYPDLVNPAPAGLFISREWWNGSYHYLLRFDNTVANYGGRLELTANFAVSRDVYQNVYDRPIGGALAVRTRVGSDLIFHPQHNHFHFEGIAAYEILKKDSTGNYRKTQFRGTKTSYCIIDYVRMSSSARTSPEYAYCNDRVQGLSAGWGDLYYSSLPEQWVDLGGSRLPDGDYALQSTANPLRKIKESNIGNNVGVRYFTIRNGSLVTSGQTPACSATPASVKPGGTVQISCTRINLGTTVDFRWGSTGGPILATVTSSAEHKALASVTVPDAELGAHPIFGVVRSSGAYYGAVVNISPSFTIQPDRAKAGDSIAFSARGFAGGEQIAIRLDGVTVTSRTAGVNGTANGSFAMPASVLGTHTVSAVGQTSGASVSTQVTTLSSLSFTPAFAHVGSSVSPILRGFQANETVEIAVQGGATLETVQVNATGALNAGGSNSLTLPLNLTTGNQTIVATGLSSRAAATFSLLVLAVGANTPTATTTATNTPTAAPVADVRRVTTNLNMRTGPATSYSIAQVLPAGTMVTVTGPGQTNGGNTWVPVRLSTGATGWVADLYLQSVVPTPTRTPTRTATPSRTPTASITPGGPTQTRTATAASTPPTVWQVTSGLNLRTGPGTTFAIVELLPAGTRLIVTGSSQQGNGYTFLPVKKESDGVTGWVATNWVTSLGTATATPTGGALLAAEVGTELVAATETETVAPASGTVRLDEPVLRWLPEILAASQSTGLPAEIIAAVIRATSGGDPNVTGENGSAGLMHVAPAEFNALGISAGEWHVPATNILAGASVIASLWSALGSLDGAVAAYFGDGCTAQGYCAAQFVSDVRTWAGSYAVAVADPLNAGYALLPASWVAPPVAPYQVTGELRPVIATAMSTATVVPAPSETPTSTLVPEPPTEAPVEETVVSEEPAGDGEGTPET